jgi:hypothetical protein
MPKNEKWHNNIEQANAKSGNNNKISLFYRYLRQILRAILWASFTFAIECDATFCVLLPQF